MTPNPGQQQSDLYRPAFVHNCLAVLVRAHGDLSGSSLANQEEPSITGLIVKRAKEVIESEDAEPWMDHLVVLDDPPQNDQAERLGKKRPRIDIEFVEARRGPRPRFHVEAKRLYRSDSLGKYVGANGLGMFLSGTYASVWPSAGMLGYVQTQGCADWRGKLADRLTKDGADFHACKDEEISSPGWSTVGLEEVIDSCHERISADLGRIKISHLLLDCR